MDDSIDQWTDLEHAAREAAVETGRRLRAGGAATRDPKVALEACAEAGLLGLSVPEIYGGSGLSARATAYVLEGFGAGCEDAGVVLAAGAHLFACTMPILEHGTEAQRELWLPALAAGEVIAANAISEPDAGSDLAGIRSRAVADGDAYLVTGSKSYVTNAPLSGLLLFYASTTPSRGYLGVSAFLVPTDSPGVELGRPFEKIGMHTALTGPVYLEDCLVGRESMLGDEGKGLEIFNASMAWERTCMFAGFLGVQRTGLARAVEYARQRRQFRRPILRFGAVHDRLLDGTMRLERARVLLYRACAAMDAGRGAALEVASAKLALSEACIDAAMHSIRTQGGLGVVMESGAPQQLADSLPALVFSGTSDLQREAIARELGL